MNLRDAFLQELGPAPSDWPQTVPDSAINDDDWYILDADTNRLIRTASGKTDRIAVQPGQVALRGLRVKLQRIQMWQREIPDFCSTATLRKNYVRLH